MARNTANPQRLALLSEPPGPPIKLAPGCPVMRFADVSPSLHWLAWVFLLAKMLVIDRAELGNEWQGQH